MKISDEFFIQLNPSYQAVIKELEKKLAPYEYNDDSNYYEAVRKILLEFASLYLMPKEYWKEALSISFTYCDPVPLNECAYKADCQFYIDIAIDNFIQSDDDPFHFRRTIKFMFGFDFSDDHHYYPGYKPVKSDLFFPHSHLQQIFYKIDSRSNHTLSKNVVDTYKSNKAFYENLKEVNDDVEKWFTLLCEIGHKICDENYIRHNIQYRLGSNLLDTKLWKLYIEYLRENDPREMLQIYSKYCRFFLDDSEMKEKYKQEVEKYGPVYVPWKNLFEFESAKIKVKKINISEDEESDQSDEYDELEIETDESEDESDTSETEGPSTPKRLRLNEDDTQNDEAEDDNNSHLQDPYSGLFFSLKSHYANDEENGSDSKSQNIDISNVCKRFYKTFQNQNFPFKNPFVIYVLDNANHKVLKKLHYSCKYFYFRKQTPICRRLSTKFDKSEFCEESLALSSENDFELFLKNTIITTTFDISYINIMFDTRCATENFTSEIISKLYRCEAKYVYINCNLSVDELKFLLQSGNVTIFQWFNRSKNLKLTRLEQITQYLPKIEELHLNCIEVTSQTFQIMLNQIFTSKIFWFSLDDIDGEAFDTIGLINFCIKNQAEYFNLYLNFSENFPNRKSMSGRLREKLKNYQKATKHMKYKINRGSYL